MSTTELALDLDRAIDSAVADVGEALHLRRRAVGDAGLRRGLLERLETPAAPSELDPMEAARRATALFILGRDREVGPYATRSGNHRVSGITSKHFSQVINVTMTSHKLKG